MMQKLEKLYIFLQSIRNYGKDAEVQKAGNMKCLFKLHNGSGRILKQAIVPSECLNSQVTKMELYQQLVLLIG